MDHKKYTESLGKLVSNLHGLEFALRAFLHKLNANESQVKLDSIRVGECVCENSFTNYDSLGDLIRKFNEASPRFCAVTDVVQLRDMLAHGRIAGKTPTVFPMQLVKFGRARNGRVQVTALILMDDEWFKTNTKLVNDQVLKVASASKDRGWDVIELC
jgi:hypothetical protein